jgi:hypothetical protein
MRIAGFAVGSVGIAGLAVGAFAGVRALSLRANAKSGCDAYPNGCGPDAFRANDDARTFATVSTITLAAGGALLVAGAVLVIVSNRGDAARSALRFAPTGLEGRF